MFRLMVRLSALEDMLRQHITPKMDTWDLTLPVLKFAINKSWQESIHGMSVYINYGRHPRTPDDVRSDKPSYSKDPKARDFVTNVEKSSRPLLSGGKALARHRSMPTMQEEAQP